MKKIKKYWPGTESLYANTGGWSYGLGNNSGMTNPGNAALKQYTTTSSSTIPTGSLPASGDISQVAYTNNTVKTPSFKDKAGAFMNKNGGAITQAAGTLLPLLMKKPDPNAKPYKKGSNMIKYQTGTKSLTKNEGKVAKGSEYFAQAKKLTAQEKADFRKLDSEAKQKGMTFEYKGLKYDPTNPANLTTPTRSSNAGITYSSGMPAQTTAQPTTTQASTQSLVTDTGTTQQTPARTARKIVGKVDAKTGYSIYPNNRVYDPKSQVMGKLDTKGNISWDNGKKETIATSTAAAATAPKVTPVAADSAKAKQLIKTKQAPKEGELTDEDRALNADLISLGLDLGSIISPEPISAGGMAIGSQIAANKARRLRKEDVGLGTHLWETTSTALAAVPLVGDYARAGNVMKTIGRVLKSPSTRKLLTAAGAAGVGLGGDQALNSMNEIYQKYEKEGLTSLGKDDLRKAMEAIRFMTNATQVGKGVSNTVKKSVTLPTAQELMVPEKGIKFGVTNKGNATKQVVGGAKVNKQGELEYDMTKQGKRPADMTEVEGDLRRTRREQTVEKAKKEAPKKQEEFSKEFQKKTGYKTRAEMRQAEADKAAKAKERKRADYKSEKQGVKEKYEASLIKFNKANEATKEAVKKNFKSKQAAKRNIEENTPPELVVMRKMGDKTPAPIKMTSSQRMLPEGPEQITSKESQEVINRINQRTRTSSNKTKAELEAENAALKTERESRQAPIVYKSDLPSGEIKGLLPEPADLKAARLAAEEKRLIKYAEEQAKADIAATMVKPKTQKIKISRKLYNMGRARGIGGVRRQN